VSTVDAAVVAQVREALASAADPSRAAAMQAYMKSSMPFRGVSRPALVSALRPVLKGYRPVVRESFEATVRALFDDAEFREERYAALLLLSVRAADRWRDPDLVPLLEHLVVDGAWWDLVDDVAAHQVAPLHRSRPDALAPVVRGWAVHDDLWLRRTAILSQLGSGVATDHDLLVEVISANAERREFWLRKAIGWALRDLAHREPDWVRAYLAEEGRHLSGLSRREAARNLDVDRAPR
jgi:3-methyladenine DNA glycosylase AlkD